MSALIYYILKQTYILRTGNVYGGGERKKRDLLFLAGERGSYRSVIKSLLPINLVRSK